METISLKMDSEMLTSIDSTMKKHKYSTRTEFIRSAIREKLDKMSREELLRLFLSFRGKAKRHVSDEEFERNRVEAGKEILREHGIDLD
jgi:Arc/MetJ-type ribon-helix-helix transcriptional regulator